MVGTLTLRKGTGNDLNEWTASGIETEGVTYTFYTTTTTDFTGTAEQIGNLTEVTAETTGLSVDDDVLTIASTYADENKYLVVKASKDDYEDVYKASTEAIAYAEPPILADAKSIKTALEAVTTTGDTFTIPETYKAAITTPTMEGGSKATQPTVNLSARWSYDKNTGTFTVTSSENTDTATAVWYVVQDGKMATVTLTLTGVNNSETYTAGIEVSEDVSAISDLVALQVAINESAEYGTVTLESNLTINDGQMLEIPEWRTLNLSKFNLTNNGRIENEEYGGIIANTTGLDPDEDPGKLTGTGEFNGAGGYSVITCGSEVKTNNEGVFVEAMKTPETETITLTGNLEFKTVVPAGTTDVTDDTDNTNAIQGRILRSGNMTLNLNGHTLNLATNGIAFAAWDGSVKTYSITGVEGSTLKATNDPPIKYLDVPGATAGASLSVSKEVEITATNWHGASVSIAVWTHGGKEGWSSVQNVDLKGVASDCKIAVSSDTSGGGNGGGTATFDTEGDNPTLTLGVAECQGTITFPADYQFAVETPSGWNGDVASYTESSKTTDGWNALFEWVDI